MFFQETEQLKDTLIEQSLDQNRKEMDLGRREMELSQQLESTRKQVLQLQNEKAAAQKDKEKIAALEAEVSIFGKSEVNLNFAS